MTAATTPPINSQMDLSVGEPVKNLEKPEPIEFEALTPQMIRTMPPTSRARKITLFILLMSWIISGCGGTISAGNCLMAARLGRGGASVINGLLYGIKGRAGALLNPAIQFIMLALDKLEIIIRQAGPFLLQLAFSDVPVAFNFKCIHNRLFCFLVY